MANFKEVILERLTKETEIILKLKLKSSRKIDIDTGIGFFDHMLELFAYHGFMDLQLKVDGDLNVDGHHTVEDVAIVLGQAIKKVIGDKAGIKRYADITLPMDECLVQLALDFSGRAYYQDDLEFTREKVGEFPVELVEEFFRALANNAGITLHIRTLRNGNAHHLIEACFKALGRAFDQALIIDSRLEGQAPSTKGTLNG